MNRIVILAAGKGTRMGSDLPKAVFPLKGRPMIEYLLDSVRLSRVDPRPLLVVSPDNRESISSCLSGYDLDYAIQDRQLGTGHAVASVRPHLGDDVKNIIVLYCDHPFISASTISSLAQAGEGKLFLMPTKLDDFSDWRKNFYHWGRIKRGSSGLVQGIVEFKDASEEERNIGEVNPGIMRLDREWFFANVDRLNDRNAQKEYYLTDMAKIAFEEGLSVGDMPLEAHEAMGINSQEELALAERILDLRH